jgi:hypothetical protein
VRFSQKSIFPCALMNFQESTGNNATVQQRQFAVEISPFSVFGDAVPRVAKKPPKTNPVL